ncbi:proline dehydrogenase family protein [Cohnella suwonensis]|uniref:proline dehydrogenase n=1 Tax=Cohnella suwonensis TaxID=696072 RepID=A0ABW0LXH7_9BACL
MITRNVFLALSRSAWATHAARIWGLRFGARRFVAGETVETAIEAVRELNALGIKATLDHLGESVTDAKTASEMAECCFRTLDAIRSAGVDSNLSLKLTQIGLDVDRGLCRTHLGRILDRAREYGNFVRIDMEGYAHNEATLSLFEELRAIYGETVGAVIQAYLYKSEADVERLSVHSPNLRFVKGAYKESPEVAYPDKADVDRNFVRLVEAHAKRGHYAAIATHDEAIIARAIEFALCNGIPKTAFEFQMLYGIRPELQRRLADDGYTVRVYVPFGDDWYGYFMRRLAERPANVWFVLKSMRKS